MDISPKVSVLVSAYNHERYIEECIESILNQTYANIELIVIDDGSHDSTPNIVANIQLRATEKNKTFTFIRKKNTGLSDTLNQALALATGKYICQFGSDDVMFLDKTEKQVRFMEENPDVAVCGGNALLIDADGKVIAKRQKFPPDRHIHFEQLFANTAPGIVASTCMIRRAVLDKEGGWDPEIPLEDMYMWFKLTSRNHSMFGANDVLMYYRKHGSNSYQNTRYMFSSMIKTIDVYREHPLYPQVRSDLMRSYFLTASKHDRKLAREILAKISLSAYNWKVLRGIWHLLCNFSL